MNKKSWKQKIAAIMVCVLLTSIISTNTTFASYGRKSITIDNLSIKANRNEIKENDIKESINEEESSPELNRILEECKEVKADKSSTELRRGEIVSVESISGDYTKMAIMSNGDLYCWGSNGSGQVGNGKTENQLTPYYVLSGVKSVIYSCSSSFCMSAITETGDLYCWGDNHFGQVGNGTTNAQFTPYHVLSGEKVKSVIYSYSYSDYYNYYSYSCVSVITEEGDLYCWGYNKDGQVGNGKTENQLTPYHVLSGEKVKSVTYSYPHFDSDFYYPCVSAITEAGDLYCWGYNKDGQVGNGKTENQLTPYHVLSGEKVKSVTYSYSYYPCVSAITEAGDLYCWGYNGCGQVGNGKIENQLTPYHVLSGEKVKSVTYFDAYTSATSSYPCVSAITEAGDLYCWGSNGSGQVGNGKTENQLTPYHVLSGEKVKSVTCFYSHYPCVSAITEAGDLYCWGYNKDGQVGNGKTENQLTPYHVLSGEKVKSVTYSYHPCVSAITEAGDLYCWGYNEGGQVGNGKIENQLTPYHVLSGVKSVTFFFGISAITKTGDLYCWGYNYDGQVGNGTTQNQLTPFKVSFEDLSGDDTTPSPVTPSDGIVSDVSRFTLSETASGTLENGSLTFSGHIYLEDGKNVNDIQWQKIADSIKWTTSDSSVVTDIKCQPVLDDSDKEYGDILILVSVSLKSAGTAMVTGTVKDGLSSSCDITVSGENNKKEVRHITGILKEVNLNLFTVVIDNTEYGVTDDFDISSAYSILLDSECKTVAIILTDNKVSKMDSVVDIVGPKVSVSFEPHSVSYQGGNFDNTKVKIKVSLSCGAQSPYKDSDIEGTEAENISVNFSEYTIRIPKGLEFKEILSSSPVVTDKISDTLKFGMTKNYEQTAYVKKDYVPEKVKDTLSVTVTATGNGQEVGCNAELFVANLDKQNETADNKDTSKDTAEAEALMNKITFAMGGDGYYNKEQLNTLETVVKTWIAEMLVTQILIKDNEDNSIWAEFCKEAGYSDAEKKKFLTNVAKKTLKKLGLDIAPIIDSDIGLHWQDTEAGTEIRVYYEDGKTYDKVTVNLQFGSLSFTGKTAFTGFGKIDYTIKTPDKKEYAGVGSVTFADLQTFSERVQDMCKKQIKKVFNLDIGSNLDKGAEWIRKQINNTTENKIIETLTSDTTSKLLSKKFGKFSDNVFKIYTKAITNKTNGSVHCPVDIYIYDSYGTLCGSIVNNQIETDNGDIFLYCVEDEKYFSLTGDDYKIQFVGNDEGSMTYRIDEYCNLELIRSIIYENVKLQKNKIYQGMIPQTQLLDSTIYNLVSMDNAEMIIPSSDTRMDNKTDIDSSPSQSPSSKPANSGSPSQSPSSAGNIPSDTSSPSPSQKPSGGVSISGGGGITTVFTPTPAPTAIPSPLPSTTATTTPSPKPVTTPSSDNNGDDNYNTDKVYNISDVATVKLSKKTFVYNGKVKKPKVTVSKNGSKLIKNTDYTVSYYNNTKVGTASVIINGIGNYSGSINKTFKIIPKGTAIKGKVQAEHKDFTVKWKKQPKSTTGYQVQYSTNKKFNGKTTAIKTITKNSVTKFNISKLKAKKKYYVRVRTYKTVKGKKYYSKWSKSKTVTTKG